MNHVENNSTRILIENTFYRGRFAPSPTGPLHFGSLVAAVGSYADALHHNGSWLLRIDNVDKVRTRPGSVDLILNLLESFGFEWSETPTFQSDRIEVYKSVLDKLLIDNRAFHCGCTRKEMDTGKQSTSTNPLYPGTCRNGLPAGKKKRSIRLRVEDIEICFNDRFSGQFCQNLSEEIGDFVIRRADGFIAYQLAVVVDDYMENITHVLRGADLLDSTPRQLYLQRHLGFPSPNYGHVPLVTDSLGRKLSKNENAPELWLEHPTLTLLAAWRFLGQVLPHNEIETVSDFWSNAKSNWCASNVPIVATPIPT